MEPHQFFDLIHRCKIQVAFDAILALATVIKRIGVLLALSTHANVKVFQVFKLLDVGSDLPVDSPNKGKRRPFYISISALRPKSKSG